LPSISKYIKKRYYQCIISKKVRTIRSQSRTAYSVNMNIYQFICTGIAKLKSQSKNKSLSQIRFLSLTTFHFISHTIHLLASNFLGFATTFLLRGTKGLLEGTKGLLRGTKGLLGGTQGLLEGTQGLLKDTQGLLRGTKGLLRGTKGLFKSTQGLLGGTQRLLGLIEQKIDNLTVNFNVFNIKEHIKYLLNQQRVILLRIPKHKGTIFRQSLKVSNYSIG